MVCCQLLAVSNIFCHVTDFDHYLPIVWEATLWAPLCKWTPFLLWGLLRVILQSLLAGNMSGTTNWYLQLANSNAKASNLSNMYSSAENIPSSPVFACKHIFAICSLVFLMKAWFSKTRKQSYWCRVSFGLLCHGSYWMLVVFNLSICIYNSLYLFCLLAFLN